MNNGWVNILVSGCLIVTACACILSVPAAHGTTFNTNASTEKPDLFSRSLEELLNTSVEVVTKSKQSALDAPGIVSVITRDEIIASGARDLVDTLIMVPGLHFAMDNQNFVSLGVRGAWAQEGKILLLVDGQEFNEPYYSCLEFGNHFPIDQIERIEIIRGPGSVMYGGYAELGVINIITRGADDFQGAYIRTTYGQMEHSYGRRNLSLQYARKYLEDDLKLSVSAYVGEGHRSDRVYRDFAGNQFDMADGDELDPRWLNVGIDYKKLQLRFIYDGHKLGMEDGMDSTVPPVTGSNTGYFAEARYTWDFGSDKQWTLIPRLQFRRSLPWQVTDPESPLFFDYTGDRYLYGLSAWNQTTTHLRLNAGMEWTQDYGKLNDERLLGLQAPLQDGQMKVGYTNAAGYAQALWEGEPANFTLGARYEDHSEVGSSFVPRAAITKSFDKAHIKLLYALAFRSPSFLNISLGKDIKPEETEVIEAEFGYQFNKNFYAGTNVFDQTIKRPIVYFSGGGDEGYRNFNETGTRGFEIETRYKYQGGYINLNYSFYTAKDKNDVDLYVVDGHPSLLRAFPAHKVTLSGSFAVTDHLSLNPSAVFTSDRYANDHGHIEVDAAGSESVVGELGNAGNISLINLHALYRNIGEVKGFDAGLGIFNLFDSKAEYLQPYNSAHAPLPGPSREVMVWLSYTFGATGQ